jgi:predicted acylesterase/phospholipase RssA
VSNDIGVSNHIGLALSGGGFRASFFHLGVIKFLRDKRLLGNVKYICSVSGGSILAAHLMLNWEAYKGSDEKAFIKALNQFKQFAQLCAPMTSP